MTPALLLALTLASAPPPAPPAAAPSFLRELSETRGYRAGSPSRATVVPGGAEVIFLRSGPRSGVLSLFATDVATGKTRELLTAEALLASEPEDLSDAEKARLERQRITARGITHYEMAQDGRTFLASLGGRLYAVDRTTGEKRRVPTPQGALDPRLSPDGKQVAFVAGGELHVLDIATGKARALTTGATEWKTHGLAEFVAQEEMDRPRGVLVVARLPEPGLPGGRRHRRWRSSPSRTRRDRSGAPSSSPTRAPDGRTPGCGWASSAWRAGPPPGSTGTGSDTRTWPRCAGRRGRRSCSWSRTAPRPRRRCSAPTPRAGRPRSSSWRRTPAWLNLNDAALRWMPDGSGFLWFTERNGGAELELRAPGGARRLRRRSPGVRLRRAGRGLRRRRGLLHGHAG